MNTITLTLCASTRTGCLSGPIHSCADERLTLAGDVTLSDGTSVALLTPRGNTLAHTILSEECAPGATIPLSTITAQAYDYTRSCRTTDSREAAIAVGDSSHPLAIIPVRVSANALYELAPPAYLAPAYPTTETLKSLLAEMQAASNAAAQSATAASKSAEEAGESASSAASDRATAVFSATSAQSYAEVATAAQARSSTSAAESATSAANAASSAAAARDAASSAMSAANSAAGSASKAAASADSAAFALTASTNAANRAEVAAEKAREADISAANSAIAASQSATFAAQEAADGVTALLQGKVDAAEAAKAGADAAKTAAETAKAGAEAAKAASASSATAAANSAAAAKQSATDLADAVATAESLDGRLSVCEDGVKASVTYFAPIFDVLYERKLVTRTWADCQIIATLHRGVILIDNYNKKCVYWLHPDGTTTEVVTSGGTYLRFSIWDIRAIIADNVNKATNLFWEVSGQKHYTKFSGDESIEDELLDAYPGHIGELTFGIYGVAGYNGHYILGDGTIIEREDAVALDESGNEVSIRFAKTAEFATAYKTGICTFFKNFYRSATFVTMYDWTQRKWFNVTDNEDGTASVTYSIYTQSSDASLVFIPAGDRSGICLKKVASSSDNSTYYFYASGNFLYWSYVLRPAFNTYVANGILDMTSGIFIDGDTLWVCDGVAQYRVLARGLFGAMNISYDKNHRQLVSDFDGYTYLNLYVYYHTKGFPQRTYIFKKK